MAKLYVKSPNGTVHNLEIVTDSFGIGGQADTNYTQHSFITHTGYLVTKRNDVVPGTTIYLPFSIWAAGVYTSLRNAPDINNIYYYPSSTPDPDNANTTASVTIHSNSTKTKVHVLIVGQIWLH